MKWTAPHDHEQMWDEKKVSEFLWGIEPQSLSAVFLACKAKETLQWARLLITKVLTCKIHKSFHSTIQDVIYMANDMSDQV